MAVIIERKEGKPKRKDYLAVDKTQIHQQYKSILLSILFISIIVSSGCLDNNFFESKITYEKSPVQVSYDLSYGYHIKNTSLKASRVLFTQLKSIHFNKHKINKTQIN